ncbi:MAG: response regulator transcription factor [Aliishimia sp.]
MTEQSILIVDDDPQIRDVLRIALKQADLNVEEAGDGAEGLKKAAAGRFDLVVLDIGLPRMDGLQVCRALRTTSDVPVLFLTARDDEIDRVLGFELGGDDYVTKPFSPRELVARIRAILKRTATSTNPIQATSQRGILVIDATRHHCVVDGKSVTLTAREMAILGCLMARPEHVVPRPALVDQVYGTAVTVSDRTLDSHLRNLRAKLADAGCVDAIETVHGVGIRMGLCQSA